MLRYSYGDTGRAVVFTDPAFDIFNCLFILYGQVTSIEIIFGAFFVV